MKVDDRAEAAVILCAGGSRRMGRSKGLLLLDGQPLLTHHVRALRPYVRQVVVVLGHAEEAHRDALPDEVLVVVNRRWRHTMPADSLALALEQADVVTDCLVTPVDTPPPTPGVLNALLSSPRPAVPVAPDGRSGHPVLLGASIIRQVRSAPPAGGLRALLHDAHPAPVADPWVSRDFDTPPAWSAFVASRGS